MKYKLDCIFVISINLTVSLLSPLL